MQIRELLTESQVTLTANDLIKHGPDRLNNLISMIKTGKPLFKADGTPVTIKKTVAKQLQDMYAAGEFRGRIALTGTDGQTYPLSSFLKTADFGGQSVPPGQGKEPAADVKPGQVFQHGELEKGQQLTAEVAINLGAFHAGELGQRIIRNKYLDTQGAVGQAIKQIAKEIDSGSVPIIPKLPTTALNNIQNYGFEYLGVQQLIKGTATFPNADAFYNHVGSNLEELVLYFPASAGNPLADSYVLKNKATENAIFISSKGAKGGAPSSIKGLKIPDNMKKMIKKDPPLEFINLLQTSEAWKQPFNAANYLSSVYPGSMGKLEKFLPFDDAFLNYLEQTWNSRGQGVPATLEEIPRKYRPIFKLVQESIKKTATNELFYDIRYYVKHVVQEAVRRDTIPNFNQRMLELLGENFVLLKTEKEGKPGTGHFVTKVTWPSKVGGKVTFEHKDPAPKWTSSMTWKLT